MISGKQFGWIKELQLEIKFDVGLMKMPCCLSKTLVWTPKLCWKTWAGFNVECRGLTSAEVISLSIIKSTLSSTSCIHYRIWNPLLKIDKSFIGMPVIIVMETNLSNPCFHYPCCCTELLAIERFGNLVWWKRKYLYKKCVIVWVSKNR